MGARPAKTRPRPATPGWFLSLGNSLRQVLDPLRQLIQLHDWRRRVRMLELSAQARELAPLLRDLLLELAQRGSGRAVVGDDIVVEISVTAAVFSAKAPRQQALCAKTAPRFAFAPLPETPPHAPGPYRPKLYLAGATGSRRGHGEPAQARGGPFTLM